MRGEDLVASYTNHTEISAYITVENVCVCSNITNCLADEEVEEKD